MGFVASIDQVYMNIRIVYPYLCLFPAPGWLLGSVRGYILCWWLFSTSQRRSAICSGLQGEQKEVTEKYNTGHFWQKDPAWLLWLKTGYCALILFVCAFPPCSVTMYIVLAYFILHLLYDVLCESECKETAVSELAKVINPYMWIKRCTNVKSVVCIFVKANSTCLKCKKMTL